MRHKLLIALLIAQSIIIVLALGPKIYNNDGNQQDSDKKVSHSFCDKVTSNLDTTPIATFSGRVAKPDFSTLPAAALYKTVITNDLAEGPNFAGKYRFLGWGCGTDCMDYAIVNVETGKIIKFGFDNPSPALTADFSINSNVLVFNSKEFVKEFYGKSRHEILQSNDWFKMYQNLPRLYYQMINDGQFEYLNLVCAEHILDGVALED